MNEQLYEKMWQSAESWLIPEFRRQYVECGKVEDCPEYDQMLELGRALRKYRRKVSCATLRRAI